MSMPLFHRYSFLGMVCAVLVSCGNEVEPAQHAISDINTRVSSVSEEARRYAPEQLARVQSQLDGLKARFDRQDYVGVVKAAPVVMLDAQELAANTAARKIAVTKEMNDEWAALAALLPADAAAIQGRIEALSKATGKHVSASIDLNGARASLSNNASIWSKAQAAFAVGNMTEALSIGKGLKARYQTLALSLKMDLPASAARVAAP